MKLPSFLFFLVISFTAGCGQKTPADSTSLDILEQRYAEKLQLLRNETINHRAGWPADNECDGALWAGIARAAGADWVDVAAGLQPDGRPTRMPHEDCGPGHMGYNDGAAATTSNDMITGLILGLYTAKDTNSLLKIYQYGEQHDWIMGYPEWYLARVLLRPNGVTLLARAMYKLTNGEKDYAIRLAPVLYGPVQSDYEQHLILLSRYLERQMGGPQYGMELAEKLLAKTLPNDALAQAVAGKYQEAINLLTSDYISPTYVRGDQSYHLVHWLLASRIVITDLRQMIDSSK